MEKVFSKRLAVRLCVFALLVETVALLAVGLTHLAQGFAEIDHELVARAHTPGLLMNREVLPYESVADRALMRELAGPDFADAVVATATGQIYYASDPALVDKNLAAAPWIDPAWANGGGPEPRLFPGQAEGAPSLVSVVPMTTFSAAEPFFRIFVKIDAATAAAKKQLLALRVLGGAGLCLAASALLLLWYVRRSLDSPLRALEQSAEALARGEFNAPHVPPISQPDELGAIAARLDALRIAFKQKDLDILAARNSLAQKDERLRAFVNALPDIVFVLDAGGRYLEVLSSEQNPIYAGSERIAGKTVQEIIPAPQADAFMDAIRDTLVKQEPRFLEYQIMTRRGMRWFEGRLSPICAGPDNPAKVLWFAQDISARKNAEEHRRSAIEADAANLAKSEFLAAMSHEIRTPLSVIFGMGELLEQSPLNEEQMQYVQLFNAASENLLELVDDILDISRVEAGRITLERAPFNLVELVETVCDALAPRAHQKNLDLCLRIAPGTPERLIGDAFRLRQVLTNLLSNAIKFTQRGEILLTVDHDAASVLPGSQRPIATLVFHVADTGVGIPNHKLELIFERFTQGDASSTRQYGGAGLGLSISKSLLELMGGAVVAESQVGRGSVFTCSVPLEIAAASSAPCPDFSSLTVLVADDHRPTRTALRELLESWSVSVLEAAALGGACRALEKANQGEACVALALCDPRMEGMDDPIRLDRLKALGQGKTTFIRLAAADKASYLPPCEAALYAASLRKPVKRADLAALLEPLCGATPHAEDLPKAAGQEGAETRLSADALPPISILLAEDAEFSAFVVKAYLKNSACKIDLASTGVEAVEKFKLGRYDLVFMDVHMPYMDGYAATAAIRNHEAAAGLRPTPILALTANALAGDEEKSLAAGCTAHLSKPVRKRQLIAAILQHCPAPPVLLACSPAASRIPVAIHPDLLCVAPKYLAVLRENADRVSLSLGLADYEPFQRLGHQMKGEGQSFGFQTISRIGAVLEAAARNKELPAIRAAVDELIDFLDRVDIG